MEVYTSGVAQGKAPSGGCVTQTLAYTLTLTSSQRIQKIDAYRTGQAPPNSKPQYLYKIVFTLNDESVKTYEATPNYVPSISTLHSYPISVGSELIGLNLAGDISGNCQIDQFNPYSRSPLNPTTCPTSLPPIILDLTNVDGKSQYLFASTATTLSFSATIPDPMQFCCITQAIEYQISYSGAATPNLISLSSTTQPIITFAVCSIVADAIAYTIKVEARFKGQSSYQASAQATYTYKVDPCSTATIIANPHPAIITTVLVPASSSVALWYDSVSGSATVQSCGPFTVSINKNSVPTAYVEATMGGDFTWSTTSGISTLSINPQFSGEVGSFNLYFTVKLTNYPSVTTGFANAITISACVVTSVTKVVQSSGMSDLNAQSYSLSSTTSLQYQLAAVQTPNCGYSITGGSVSNSGTPFTSTISSIDSSGKYLFGPTTDASLVGTGITITIQSVVVDGVTYSNSQLTAPFTFILNILASCNTAVVLASVVSDISLYVWDSSSALYPSGSVAFTEFEDSISGSNPTICPKTYSVSSVALSINGCPLDAFNYVAASRQFSISSQSLCQIGSYTAFLTGVITNYPSQFATRQFTITVKDPCLITVLISPTLSTMTQQILQKGVSSASTTQDASFKDSISEQHPSGTSTALCGAISYTILSVKLSAQDALSATELSIDPTTGLVSLQAINQNTVGTHSVTVIALLSLYPAVPQKTSTFTVEILPGTNDEFTTIAPIIEDQIYILNQSPLVISFDSFITQPASFNTGPTFIQLYLYNATSSLSSLDLSSSCLTKIDDVEWASFNESSRTLLVSTADLRNVGQHQALVVQNFQDYPNVTPFTTFSIYINDETKLLIIQQPPYFEYDLINISVIQCPDSVGQLWSLELPNIIDPNQRNVTVSASLNTSLFFFDNETNSLRQKKTLKVPITEIINMTLTNQLNLTATYSFKVQFICQVPVVVDNIIKDKLEIVAKQKKWPQAYISSIEPSGLMHVKFRQRMVVPDHPEYIQNETITLNGTIYPIIRIDLLAGKYSNYTRLNFNWTFVNFTSLELLLQLDFENKAEVSMHNTARDQVQLTIYGFQLFADISSDFMLAPTILTPFELPNLVSESEIKQAKTYGEVAQRSIQTVMVASTFISIAIKGPLQCLLDSVKQLQLIVHIMLVNVAYPVSATVFFGLLMEVLTFQFYDFTDFYNQRLKLDADSPGNNALSNQFGLMGYQALYIIQNFGTLCWTLFIAPLCWTFSHLVVIACKGEFAYLKTKFSRMMFFNYWVGYFNETYLFLAVCAGLNMLHFKWGTYGEAINSFLALFFGLIIIVYPFYVAVFYNLTKNYQKIMSRDIDFLERFGSVFTGKNLKRQGRLVVLHSCATLLRKLWLAYIVIFHQDKPVYSIFQLTIQALIMMFVTGYSWSMVSRTANKMELINETFVLLFTYHLYAFTDFMTDVEVRAKVGQSLVICTCTCVLLNLGVVALESLLFAARKLKLQFLKFRQGTQIRKQKKMKRKAHQESSFQFFLKELSSVRSVTGENNLSQQQQEPEIPSLNRSEAQNHSKNKLSKVYESQLVFQEPKKQKTMIPQTSSQLKNNQPNSHQRSKKQVERVSSPRDRDFFDKNINELQRVIKALSNELTKQTLVDAKVKPHRNASNTKIQNKILASAQHENWKIDDGVKKLQSRQATVVAKKKLVSFDLNESA